MPYIASSHFMALRGFVALLLFITASQVHAATPLPPCLGQGPCSPSESDIFDLSGYDIPAEIMCPWPTSPRISSSVTVNSPAEMQTALDQGGIEVRVGWSGTRSGNIHIRRDDVRVVMPNNATLDGQINISSRNSPIARVEWTGGNQTTGPFILDQADDVLVYDFHSTRDFTQGDTFNDMRCSPGGCNRTAFVKSTFEGYNPENRTALLFYTAPNPSPSNCMILADFASRQVVGGGQVGRIQANRNVIIVRSVWDQPDQGGTSFRFHQTVVNAFVGDTHIRGRIKLDEIPASEEASVLNGVFDNVTVYNGVNRIFASQGPMANTGEVRNSTVYTTVGNDGGGIRQSPLIDRGGNALRDWNGSSFPLPDSRGAVPDVDLIGAQR